MRLFNKFEVGYWNVGVIEQPISHIMKGESYSIRWLEHRIVLQIPFCLELIIGIIFPPGVESQDIRV